MCDAARENCDHFVGLCSHLWRSNTPNTLDVCLAIVAVGVGAWVGWVVWCGGVGEEWFAMNEMSGMWDVDDG